MKVEIIIILMENEYLKNRWICILMMSVFFSFLGCNEERSKGIDQEQRIDEISANEDVARYLKSFKGLGALTDGSEPTPAPQSISRFQLPEDLALDLVLSEPDIVQPVEISFDAQGRLWVVQYSQYPFPEGLKITDVDNFLRFTYDSIPLPPPEGIKGADKISIFEDKTGDGKYEFVADAITGLNITTSVLTGRGRIWVLNPPYLLSYPDEDGDGIPDGDPRVELVGFGLEDPHAVANSLRWGPDGWLYGGQGSTVTANISSSVTKNVEFSGQVIWRYNTETEVFEVFAEGGGNTFNLEFDSKGRLFSGNNGYDRGPNFKQGAYYPRSLGKHGGYTNPYTFGNLENMELVGEKLRFTHSMVIYEEGELPQRYEGKMIAINGLNHFVQIVSLESIGSTLRTIDEERIMETEDRWFRPVNIRAGPDGGVYIADWYDSRYSNTDPRDTWNKTTGRIYRLRGKDSSAGIEGLDFSKYSNEELIETLKDDRKWYRQQALQQFGDRRDRSAIPDLLSLLHSEEGQTALEALWAIHMVGGLDDEIAEIALRHSNPYVRSWSVRLLGDNEEVSSAIRKALVGMAGNEEDPEVRSQLACTAKRLAASEGVLIVEKLLVAHDDAEDPDIPLLIWWALESNVSTDIDEVLDLFRTTEIWENRIVEEVILERLMKRLVIAGGEENYDAAARLMAFAPTDQNRKKLADVLFETQGGRISNDLSPDLVKAIAPYESTLYSAPLISGIRKGDEASISEALDFIIAEEGEPDHKISYINLFGEVKVQTAVSDLTRIVTDGKYSPSMRNAALVSLQCFDDDEIGKQLVKSYPGYRGNSTTRHIAIDVLLSRPGWTKELLKAVNESRTISKDDIGVYKARSLRLYDDPEIDQGLYRAWPELRPLDEDEITRSMSKYIKVLESGKGDVQEGKKLYGTTCALCHRMDDFGGDIGPDLTGYERGNTKYMLQNTIDPNVFIREGYELYKIFTKDGRAFEGRIVSREGELITLQPPLGGRKTTLHSSEIDRIEEEQTSFMPERLLDDLTDQEVRDLFSYLQKMD